MSGLAHDLHVLITRLDRAADRILGEDFNVSYRRFLALLMLNELGPTTQRALAERLGTTEPSTSRMSGVLAEAGLVTVGSHPRGGNRRQLVLTVEGRRLVHDCHEHLERRFADLVRAAGVSYADYARATRQLLATTAAEASSDEAA